MIEIQGLSFAYPGRSKVFEDFSLVVEDGEAWSIVGPSGCGKTTLLYLLAGLLKPTSGMILIRGNPVQRPRPRTGLVLQDHGLLPWATVEENAMLGWVIRGFYGPDGKHSPTDAGMDRDGALEKVNAWLKRLRIDQFRDKYPSHLSKGQRQRAAIARTLSLEPDLLLMDEPFSALDAVIREDLHRTMLAHQQESGITGIVVTHDIEEALLMGRKVLVLSSGCNRSARVLENPIRSRQEQTGLPDIHERLEELRRMLEES
ncbi:MAG: ABC transporter ATP-binding protein [Deltaproteobacteria bacterium HGW-Deltaproteobacteria-15]|jgi:NitT/TauT family transport system ATP-binding protein|nr:MAG: ABC transporter ATP-binding protein [Deltaproteobacteria bacterium HGW-Deltaproteobacteria-15]